jgi:hypothetical protein
MKIEIYCFFISRKADKNDFFINIVLYASTLTMSTTKETNDGIIITDRHRDYTLIIEMCAACGSVKITKTDNNGTRTVASYWDGVYQYKTEGKCSDPKQHLEPIYENDEYESLDAEIEEPEDP